MLEILSMIPCWAKYCRPCWLWASEVTISIAVALVKKDEQKWMPRGKREKNDTVKTWQGVVHQTKSIYMQLQRQVFFVFFFWEKKKVPTWSRHRHLSVHRAAEKWGHCWHSNQEKWEKRMRFPLPAASRKNNMWSFYSMTTEAWIYSITYVK